MSAGLGVELGSVFAHRLKYKKAEGNPFGTWLTKLRLKSLVGVDLFFHS